MERGEELAGYGRCGRGGVVWVCKKEAMMMTWIAKDSAVGWGRWRW